MENVCHTLAGVVLARAGLGRSTPLATTALVAGANLPDVDLAWSSFRSALVYYHYHRGWTHSILGFCVLTLLLWIVLLAVDRRLLARRSPARARPLPLLLAAAAGVGSHVLMDGANSYGIRPFLPWDGRWIYGDLWVIVDPWLWLILGGAVFLTGAPGRRRTILWLMAAAAAAIVVLASTLVPASVRAAWGVGLVVLVALCRAAPRAGRSGPPAARAAAVLVVLYAGLCALSHRSALARAARLAAVEERGGAAVRVAALPHPADPLRWEAIVAGASSVRHGTVSGLPGVGGGASMTVLPLGLDGASVEDLRRSCAGRVIEEFFRFPFFAVEAGADGAREVVARDARYTRRGRGFAVYAARLDGEGRPEIDRGDCP